MPAAAIIICGPKGDGASLRARLTPSRLLSRARTRGCGGSPRRRPGAARVVVGTAAKPHAISDHRDVTEGQAVLSRRVEARAIVTEGDWRHGGSAIRPDWPWALAGEGHGQPQVRHASSRARRRGYGETAFLLLRGQPRPA
jgi:hypothetical protein